MSFIDVYNLKIIEYPNGSIQIRHYKNGKYYNNKQREICDKEVTDKQNPQLVYLTSDNLRSFNSSLNRSKNTIYELARSNKWDLFVTFTFSNKNDRTDYNLLLSKLSKWFNNIKRYAPNLSYIVVPEEHKRIEENGLRAYHFHGLLANIDGLKLSPALHSRTHCQLYTKNGLPIYNLSQYHLGWSTATYIQDTYRATNYITKYVTKAMCIRQKNKRRFISSHNLQKPTVTTTIIDNIDDIYKAFAISYEKQVNVNVGSFVDTVTYMEVDKLKDIPIIDIIDIMHN